MICTRLLAIACQLTMNMGTICAGLKTRHAASGSHARIACECWHSTGRRFDQSIHTTHDAAVVLVILAPRFERLNIDATAEMHSARWRTVCWGAGIFRPPLLRSLWPGSNRVARCRSSLTMRYPGRRPTERAAAGRGGGNGWSCRRGSMRYSHVVSHLRGSRGRTGGGCRTLRAPSMASRGAGCFQPGSLLPSRSHVLQKSQ